MALNGLARCWGFCLAAAIGISLVRIAAAADAPPDVPMSVPPAVQKIDTVNAQVEMTVNTNRILKTDWPIPLAEVANPELLDFTVLSDREVQLHAKKPGITTVTLFDERKDPHQVDVIISGDVRELERLLKLQFPTTSIKLYPTAASTLILTGYVDRPDSVNRIVMIAQDYFPKVINNMIVGGSQQVLLYVQVMQVSRTKLRNLGVDMMGFSGATSAARRSAA